MYRNEMEEINYLYLYLYLYLFSTIPTLCYNLPHFEVKYIYSNRKISISWEKTSTNPYFSSGEK